MTTVVQALAAVMDDVQAVRKTGHNQAQNFNFRGIDAVMNAVGPALRKHGVVIVPTVIDSGYRDIEVGQKRTLMREVTVTVKYTAYGPEGDCIEGVVCGESMDSGDKGTAKAFSVAYRTFLLQTLTIPTDEPDPDATSVERAARREPEPVDGPVSADNAAALIAKCEAAGLDPAQVVDKGTNGRTDDPALVLRSEVASVRAALDELAKEKVEVPA